ncbi:MAG TPA: tetratricopeptide repeat protein [Polyangia bacterium]|nr:tetratricopeptide repeat protein [Polyangia bacterium]
MAAPAVVRAQSVGDDDGRRRAQAHLSRGNDLFTSDKFQEALVEFQAAYAAFPSPKLHFNMGQCQRALGHLQDALEEFRRFVDEARDVSPDLRREAERYISELQEAKDGQARPVVSAAPLTNPSPTAASLTPTPVVAAAAPSSPPPSLIAPPSARAANEADADRPLHKRWWFWATIGIVVAGAAVGVVLLTRPHDPDCGLQTCLK